MAKFYGIGVGPGDPELLTIKASKVLGLIDTLLVPQTQKNKKGVAFTIMEPYLKENIKLIYIDFPMVANEEIFLKGGMDAANKIKEEINLGNNCAFVTLGDPTVYSTYGYILRALDQDIEVETIPGITSFCAAAAMANRPLIEKDEILSIIPMNAKDSKINKALEACDSFAFMKIYNREERVLNHIKTHKIKENALLAQRCGFSEGKIHRDIENALLENKDYLTLVLSRKGEN